MIMKSTVPKLLTAQWKHLSRGRGAHRRSRRFKESAKKQLNIESDGYLYQIMNGKIEIPDADIGVIVELINNCKSIR